jgi:oxysterol-binding protein-related protein 8
LIIRDGSTPAEQTKQILQIAAILPGQTPQGRIAIPPSRQNSYKTVPQLNQFSQTSKGESAGRDQPTSASNKNEDLIDFGQNDTPKPQSDQKPQDPSLIDLGGLSLDDKPNKDERDHKAQLAHNDINLMSKQDEDPESHASAKSTQSKQGSIVRQDSQTDEVDEFVDAES